MQTPDAQTSGPDPPDGPVDPANATRRGATKSMLSALNGWQAVPAFIIAVYCLLGIFGPTLAPFEPNKGTFATRLCPPLAIDALIATSNPPSRAAECRTDQHPRHRSNRQRHILANAAWGSDLVFDSRIERADSDVIVGVTIGVLINGLRSLHAV